VRARALQADVRVIFGKRINQNPIRFDMAITAAGEIAAQRMIFVLRRQNFTFDQQVEHRLEFRQVLAASAGKFNILFELAGAAEGSHKPKSA